MMQVTRAAFQAVASLNKQATDPKSHTLVSNFYIRFSFMLLPAISMVDSKVLSLKINVGQFHLHHCFIRSCQAVLKPAVVSSAADIRHTWGYIHARFHGHTAMSL
jgi:hypothetical protein